MKILQLFNTYFAITYFKSHYPTSVKRTRSSYFVSRVGVQTVKLN